MVVGSMIIPHSVLCHILGLCSLHAGRIPKYHDSWHRLLKRTVNPRHGYLLFHVSLNMAGDNTETQGVSDASYFCWYHGKHCLDSLFSPVTSLSEPLLTELMTFCTAYIQGPCFLKREMQLISGISFVNT